MIIQLALIGLVLAALYKFKKGIDYIPFVTKTFTQQLNDMVDNGDQLRDVTYSTMSDILQHPDVINSIAGQQTDYLEDMGVFGTKRMYFQLYTC